MSERLTELFRELIRRRVLRTSGVYLVAVWGVSQGAAELFPIFGASEDHIRFFIIGAIAFLPVVVILSWMYDIGGEGVHRDAHDLSVARRSKVSAAQIETVVAGAAERGCVRVSFQDAEGDKAVLLTREFSLGRAEECAIQYRDPVVSRQHACVTFEDGEWRIRDLGSTNGTWLNGRRVGEAALPPTCKLELNEQGPTLEVDVIPPGPATEAALKNFEQTDARAIVRTH